MISKHILLIKFLNQSKPFFFFVKWFQVFPYTFTIQHQSFVCLHSFLFDPQIELYQVQPLQVRLGVGVMVMKGFSAFPKAQRLEPHHQIAQCHIQDTLLWSLTPLQRSSRGILLPQPTGPQDTRQGESYPSAEKQSVYSTAPADWALIQGSDRTIKQLLKWLMFN